MNLMSTIAFDNFPNSRIDLHSHTTCSDGKLEPELLIERAVNYQLDVLAITDHDTTAGLASAHQYIKDKAYGLKLINGIEISTNWNGFDIHIVGLNIDTENEQLKQLITEQQLAREARATAMGEKLTKCGFEDVYDDAKRLAGKGSITRAHFAQVLFNRGEINHMQAAFDKYLGKGKRAFVKPKWCLIAEAIEVIHQAGGVAVIAHPIRYDLSGKWLRKLVVEFKAAGGDALEIVLPQMNVQQKQLMLSYCQEYDLHASMGSDFHYPSKWSDLGRNLTLPDQCQPVWQLF
ncbi:MAG: RNase RNM [Thalassotalea sp.]